MGNIERCECGMPHLGGTEHADECPAGVYVPGRGGGGSEVESLRHQLQGAVSLEAVRHGIDEIERVQYLHGTRCGDFKAALDAVRASLDLLGGQ